MVKQMLYEAKRDNLNELFNNTIGVVCNLPFNKLKSSLCGSLLWALHDGIVSWFQVFYSCPHFGSKLADMPWRMGLVFRPAPSVSTFP